MTVVRAARLDRRGVGVAGVAANSGCAHRLGGDFVIIGTYLNGLSTGQLPLYGNTVSVAGLLAGSIPLRAFAGSPVPRGSRRALTGSRRETTALRLHRDRLTRQLGDERIERPRVSTASADESGQVPPPVENATAPEASSQLMSPFSPGAPAPATAADRPSADVLHCVSLQAITMPSHSQGVITCDNVSADMSAVAYLRDRDRHRDVGRCDRKRLCATLNRPGPQRENHGKKERS
jgi:hypothetical protein